MINQLTAEQQLQIDSIFAQWNQPGSPGCALAITLDDEIVYERGYGYAQLEYDIPITPETIFHVASVSKQFTAMAIALLAAEGLVDLDANVRQYVPELYEFDYPVTVRQLVHHTSGLRDQWELLMVAGWRLDDVITKEHLMKMIMRQRELNFVPGSEYLYSNTGYTLMAEIVERVAGQTLRQFAAERIFQPLGMHDTHFHDDHEEIVKNRAYSYAPRLAGGWHKSVLSYANVGATSLFTTVRDLSQWLANFSHARVGGNEVIEQMHQRYVLNNGETIPYGFGLMFAEYKGWQEIGHSGADAGFRSWCGRIEPHGLGIVVLSNCSTAVPRELARRVADVMLADKEVKVVEAAEPHAQLCPADCAGAYLVQYLGQQLLITVKDGGLYAQLEEADVPELLQPLDESSYKATVSGAKITFNRDEAGQVNGCTWQQQGINMAGKKLPDYQLSARELAEYVGRYYSPELDTTYRLEVRDDELVVSFQRHPDVVLVPWGTDHFVRQRTPATEFKFMREAGEIVGFRLSGGRIRNVWFRRTL